MYRHSLFIDDAIIGSEQSDHRIPSTTLAEEPARVYDVKSLLYQLYLTDPSYLLDQLDQWLSVTRIKRIDRMEILTQLEDISQLQDDWDSFGANSISANCIANTKKIIRALPSTVILPEIYPNPNGTITLDWEANEQTLSIEIGDTHFSSYWVKSSDAEPVYESEELAKKMPRLLYTTLNSMYPNPAISTEENAICFFRNTR